MEEIKKNVLKDNEHFGELAKQCERLQKENSNLKMTLDKIFKQAEEMSDMLRNRRANYLFNVINSDKFHENIQERALKELEDFLYPKEENDSENSSKNTKKK